MNNIITNREKELTLQELKKMKPGAIFAFGEFLDDVGGCNIASTGKMTPWVAVRGDIHDWAIYCQNPHYLESTEPMEVVLGMAGKWENDKIARSGDKIITKTNIKKLVPCDKEAFKMYRL